MRFDGNYSVVSPAEKRKKAEDAEKRRVEWERTSEQLARDRYVDALYWSKVRQAVLDLDGHSCRLCGASGGGKLHVLGEAGKLVVEDHDAAKPYAWPLAHDVRPAVQSLGSDGGCTDCHSAGSGFLFGKVVADVPADLGAPAMLDMHTFSGEDALFHKLFGLTFIFRPWLKALGFFVSGVVLLILLAYGLPGLAVALRRLSRRAGEQ